MTNMHGDHNRVFITGTDTAIGKSVVAAILLLGLQATYWKPVQCGLQEPSDTQRLQTLTGLPNRHFLPESYVFKTPCSPHLAAALENKRIDLEEIKLPRDIAHPPLIIEGAGGVMVPLNQNQFMLDLMLNLDCPVILVAGTQLGTINHTLLSLNRLQAAGLEVSGVVMNGNKNEENKEAIRKFGKTKILAELEPLPCLDRQEICRVFHQSFSAHL